MTSVLDRLEGKVISYEERVCESHGGEGVNLKNPRVSLRMSELAYLVAVARERALVIGRLRGNSTITRAMIEKAEEVAGPSLARLTAEEKSD